MLRRLLYFIDKNDDLSTHQFGFRIYHSTTLTIIELIGLLDILLKMTN